MFLTIARENFVEPRPSDSLDKGPFDVKSIILLLLVQSDIIVVKVGHFCSHCLRGILSMIQIKELLPIFG